VSDFGGNHHFHGTMFGGGTAHVQPQESPDVHQTSVRPSPSSNPMPPARAADVSMTDPGAPPSSSTAAHAQQYDHSAPGTHLSVAQQPAEVPPSPRVQPRSQQPTPSSAHSQSIPASGLAASQSSPAQSLRSPADSSASPRRIKVKSLSHIQSFAIDDASPFLPTNSLSRRQRRDPTDVGPQYEISDMPVADIIEMVAGLLTKITTTNDRQYDSLHRQIPPPEGTAGLSQQTTSVLAFHGKNVPSISILSYLSRIHKYCPTTYEVFLSLLIYFDRMTERVNAGPMTSMHRDEQQSIERANLAAPSDTVRPATSHSASAAAQAATPPPSGSLGKPHDAPVQGTQPPSPPQQDLETDPYNLSHFFVVDSFNIHRLVIAGVTCASKFFSDVFYTNSRYAKVCDSTCFQLSLLMPTGWRIAAR
jgi:hypothetical protein